MIYLTVGPEAYDNIEFGKLLWMFREEVGYNRTEAAKRLKLSSEYLRLIEHGERTPALGRMRDILYQYEVDFVMINLRKIVIKNEIEVEFTSRVLEARRSPSDPPKPRRLRNRSKRIAEIINLLNDADDELLDTIRMFLIVKSRGENTSSNRGDN